MKLLIALLVVLGITFSTVSYAKNTSSSSKDSKSSKKTSGEDRYKKAALQYLALIKYINQAKYDELSKITNSKAQYKACYGYVRSYTLHYLQKNDPPKYKKLMQLKSSNRKLYNNLLKSQMSRVLKAAQAKAANK